MKHLDTKRKLLLFLMSCLFAGTTLAQGEKQIHGIIKTEDGKPLEFATVSDQTNTFSTTTDSNGVFTLEAPENTLLTISYVGYDAVKVQAQNEMNIVLHQSGNVLNEVVTIGYGTQTRKELFGAVTTVGEKDFQKGIVTTPEQLIAGKVAGVSVVSNGGAPGSGSTIRIRGGASLNASNDPLIVIDGVPITSTNIYGASNPLSTINPNDIATFTVLKDAAATAIYGSRASNGVILITTKQGTGGKPVFNFSTQNSVSTLAKKVDVLSAEAFRKYINAHAEDTILGKSPVAYLGNANTDWQDQIYQNAFTTDDNFSVTGGIKHMPYRISVGYLNQSGLLMTDNLKRYSGGISLTPMLFDDHLKISINVKGSMSDTRFANNAAISSAAYFDPTQPVHANNSYGNYYEWFSVDSTGNPTLNKLAPRNPVALLNMYHNTSRVYRSYGNAQLDYKFHFLPDLHANLNVGYDAAKGKGETDVPANAAQNYLDGGQKNPYSNTVNNNVLEFYLNYNKTLESIKSNINATAGYGYYSNSATNYNYPSFRANGDSIPGTSPKFAYDIPKSVLISYYARLIYTLNSKYILAATYRTDGSSRFTENRWGAFPSVAFTWRANRENFMKDSKTISDLKLRLSYGITGNQDGISNYPSLAVYSLSDNASQVRLGNNYYNMGTPAPYDSHIKWEQTATTNIGLDWGFLNNRINFTVDAYYKKTKDLLSRTPIPVGSNFASTLLTNVGNVTNKGIEFQINATPVVTKDFSWDVNFNVAYNDIKITNLTATQDPTFPGSPVGLYQINSVGYNPSAFYVYHQVYDNAGKPIEGVYADLNHDGIINNSDLYHYKSPFAKVIMGFSTAVNYKKWGLSTVLRASIGNYMYNGIATGASQLNVINPLGYLANVVTEINNSNFYSGQQYSDYYVQNASFLKMDNLSLSYNVGKILKQKVGLRLNATVQNVFTITKYTGVDPEIYGGVDNILYPRPRIYSVGANIQF